MTARPEGSKWDCADGTMPNHAPASDYYGRMLSDLHTALIGMS